MNISIWYGTNYQIYNIIQRPCNDKKKIVTEKLLI